MDGFVKTHLDRTDYFAVVRHALDHLITAVGRGKVGEDERIDVESAEACEGEVVNTVGAGDALFSAFVHFYAQGMEPLECLKRAQIFASAKIRVSGASRGFVTEAEIEEMSQWN